jgi:hypothetical protein
MSDTTTPVKSPSNWQQFAVAMTILVMFGGALAWALWTKDPNASNMMTMLSTVTVTAVGYYLGSSTGSQAKDATIAAQAAVGKPPGA